MSSWVEKLLDQAREKRLRQEQAVLHDLIELVEAATWLITPVLNLSTLEQRALHKYILAHLVARTPYHKQAASYFASGQDITLFSEAYSHNELLQLATEVGEALIAARSPEVIEQLPTTIDRLAQQLIRER